MVAITHWSSSPLRFSSLIGSKEPVSWDDVAARVPQILEQMQAEMLAAATAKYQACIEKVRRR